MAEHLAVDKYFFDYTIRIQKKTFSQRTAQHLTDRPKIPNILILQLCEVKFEVGALKKLLQAKWNSLLQLKIKAKGHIFQKGEIKILSLIPFPRLTKLQINKSSISTLQCRDLWTISSPIVELDFEDNDINDEGCMYLSKSKWKLIRLDLYQNNLGSKGVKILSRCENWKKLIFLDLSNNKIGDRGCRFVHEASWKQLKILRIYGNQISSRGCMSLSKGEFEKLQELDISINPVGWQGARSLTLCKWGQLSLLYCDSGFDWQSAKVMLNLAAKRITVITIYNKQLLDLIHILKIQMQKSHIMFIQYA